MINQALALMGKKIFYEGAASSAATYYVDLNPSPGHVYFLKAVMLAHPNTGYIGVYKGSVDASWLPAKRLVEVYSAEVISFNDIDMLIKPDQLVKITYKIDTAATHYMNIEYYDMLMEEYEALIKKLIGMFGQNPEAITMARL